MFPLPCDIYVFFQTLPIESIFICNFGKSRAQTVLAQFLLYCYIVTYISSIYGRFAKLAKMARAFLMSSSVLFKANIYEKLPFFYNNCNIKSTLKLTFEIVFGRLVYVTKFKFYRNKEQNIKVIG